MSQLGLFTITWLVRPLSMTLADRHLVEGRLLDADTHEEAWAEAERRWGPCETVVRAEDPPLSPFDTPAVPRVKKTRRERQKRPDSNITPKG